MFFKLSEKSCERGINTLKSLLQSCWDSGTVEVQKIIQVKPWVIKLKWLFWNVNVCYISSVFTDPYFTDCRETLVTISPVSGVTVLTTVAGGRSCMNCMWDSRRLKNNTTVFHCQRYFKADHRTWNMRSETLAKVFAIATCIWHQIILLFS